MKRIFLRVSLLSVVLVGLAADPPPPPAAKEPPKLAASKTRIKCTVCNGKGSIRMLHPLASPCSKTYGGKIGNQYVKIDPCPVCEKGRGWRVVWDLTKPEPSAEPPCMTCGWSGLVQCRKCLASGIVKCPHAECKDGWIPIKPQSNYKRSSNRKPTDVKKCPECKGVGKIVCPECKGMRADLCKRCFGIGRKR